VRIAITCKPMLLHRQQLRNAIMLFLGLCVHLSRNCAPPLTKSVHLTSANVLEQIGLICFKFRANWLKQIVPFCPIARANGTNFPGRSCKSYQFTRSLVQIQPFYPRYLIRFVIFFRKQFLNTFTSLTSELLNEFDRPHVRYT
jgi:hypothetical protein